MKTKDYWNSNLDTDNLSRSGGENHHYLEESMAFAATPEFEWMRKRAEDLTGKWLIDLGGGIGMHAILWAKAGARVIVIDLAVKRLAALRKVAQQAGVSDQIYLVVGSAESFPLCSGCADFVFTKSVLIHTNLPTAAKGIYRILKPGGYGYFIEPLNRNPLIRFYRRAFAPKIWRTITRYFNEQSLQQLRQPFGSLRWKPFYLVSAGSFFWQYGRKNLTRFQISLRRWRRLDNYLLERYPKLDQWCWFAAIEVQKKTEKQN